jgi:hypothetical protein
MESKIAKARDRAQRDHDELHTDPTSGAECAPNCPSGPESCQAHPDHVALNCTACAAKSLSVRRAYESNPDSAYTDALASEPYPSNRPRYAWIAEGEVSVGTLVDYARCQENAYYSGLLVSDHVTMLTRWLGSDLVGTTTYATEHVLMGESSDVEGYPDYRYLRFVIRENAEPEGKIIDAADYKIDLRA